MEMDNYQGDLTDVVVRAGATVGPPYPDAHHHHHLVPWATDFPSNSAAATTSSFSAALLQDADDELANRQESSNTIFGDPFSNFTDPLLLHHSPYLPPAAAAPPPAELGGGYGFLSGAAAAVPPPILGYSHHGKMFGDGGGNSFSGIQISTPPPSGSKSEIVQRAVSSPAVPPPRMGFNKSDHVINNNKSHQINNNNSSNNSNNYSSAASAASTTCVAGPVQISSPRNLGIKRRKSQAKKVVCIPAPATVNSRPSGEVVPSDLWAWRKYGQKPIKGSPYPRGYYRCSSSKGCSARKQVERSRTDPNMLVITYTSEHNHPWPTQRNALAGSTRAHPHSTPGSKLTNITPSTSAAKHNHDHASKAATSSSSNPKLDDHPPQPTTSNDSSLPAPKEEAVDELDEEVEADVEGLEAELMISSVYRPELMGSSDQDFFAGLDEIEGDDPLQLLLTGGEDPVLKPDVEKDHEEDGLEPLLFSTMFDWSSSSNDNSTTTSFQQPRRGSGGNNNN